MSHAHHVTVESIWISGPLLLVGLVYLYRCISAARLAAGGVKGWRVCSFLLGLLLIWFALDTWPAGLDHQSLTAHMIQHLLLMTIAPPLIFLGAPWRLFPQSSVPRHLEAIDRGHGLAFVNRMQAALLHPVVGWIGACATLIVWHIPVVFILTSHSDTLHKIEQASFLLAGLFFWRPVVEPSRTSLKCPEWWLLLYLFLATLPCDILSGFLVFCDRVVYPVYSPSSLFGFSALEDQQCAGALMWTCVTVVYMTAGAILARHLLSPLSARQPEIATSNPKLRMESPKAPLERGDCLMPARPLNPAAAAPSITDRLAASCRQVSDFWAVTKPEVNFLILITTFAGFYLGSANAGRPFSFVALFNTLLGTLLVASGTATLNQYLERNFDAQMRRTARRPAASGRLRPNSVLAFGIALSVAGVIYLATGVNLLASLLALITLLSYLFLYTPLKRKTPLCVFVGAFPGATPPLIGWAAASRGLNTEAALLFAIVFLWQFPHFMAIAWMYREDYDRAGYLVIPKGEARVPFVITATILPILALIAVSFVQFLTMHEAIYCCAAVPLGLVFLHFGSGFALQRSRTSARRLLTASIVYLPLLYALSVISCVGAT